ncbi:LOW QUALITY PROTEIN: transcription initiation factor TFIID subunit 12-like [Pollicipes pollicipes]|uniref:LOW QUALITY PROTEIN: transcription initiation factor TFIID subunit 12-like n=1 Tax=Pollicipes pollicipes TaxID=41117 RepID=UPI001884ED7D|nr:LOW QUALITY PROTEIN: transcription initiation factor TFIID subunit 12-like [Pollicipes pollicipes]
MTCARLITVLNSVFLPVTPPHCTPPPAEWRTGPSIEPGASCLQVLTKQRLHELVKEVDPNEQLDEEVEELLLQLADDFIESTVSTACQLAKHRRAATVDVKDVQLYLERKWNMWIPGFGTEEIRPYKRSGPPRRHKQRMAIIRKALKKYSDGLQTRDGQVVLCMCRARW